MARIRWVFLACSLLNIVALMPLLLWRPVINGPLQAAGIVGCGVLAFWWIQSYRRDHFAAAGTVLELVALGAICLSLQTPDQALGVIFCGLYFRALYGTWRQVMPVVLVFAAGYFGPMLLVPAARVPVSEAAQMAVGFVVSAAAMAIVATFGRSHERGALRERTLARAGAALVAATDADSIASALLDAVRDLLADTPVTRLTLMVGLPGVDTLSVLACEGPDADAIRGAIIHVSRIPQKYQVAESTKQLTLDSTDVFALQQSLGFAPQPGIVTLTPLQARSIPMGVLVVESPGQLPTECADGLSTLAAEVALAIETARLTEDLRRDIAERKALEGELAHRAFHDPLTELPNRALLVERLQHALARSRRGPHRPAVLFVDLDDFKVVNDSLGHRIGDELLISVSQRLRASIRAGDTAARLGGDEFVVLLEDIAELPEAIQVVERFLDRLHTPFVLNGHEVFVGASVGIALSVGDGTLPDDLLRQADTAMYAAKSKGKRQYVVFDSALEEHPLERLALEAELRRALERDELRVHYQPIFELGRNRVCGLEALVRWQHPRRGLVAPAAFIPLAEATGLIVPIGRWVLRQACREIKAWQDEHPDDERLVVSVNLSGRQFLDPALVEEVALALRDVGLDAEYLKLEITESTAMEAGIATIETLRALKGLGVQLAIDDFGTGYSSLSYLKRFPVDTLKIDRSFVDGLGNDPQDSAIVHSVIALARSLKLSVTAEGIETHEQLHELLGLTCDEGQGYYFARPQPSVAAAMLGSYSIGPEEARSAA